VVPDNATLLYPNLNERVNHNDVHSSRASGLKPETPMEEIISR